MKSRTSFSKLTTFKKDIVRFAPIWALYLIGMMLVLFEYGYEKHDYFARYYMNGLIEGFGVVNIIYAAVCAVMLFGDLYNTRMCYSLHAMPQRRESWLMSHLGAGMLFSLAPNILAALFLMLRLESMWYLALYWLLAVTLQFVFFFGVAAVSALLTGNRFAMLAVYAGFNFVAILIYAVLATIYVPMLPGVVTNVADFTPFSPVVHLFENFEFFKFEKYQVLSEKIAGEWETHYRYLGLGTGWGYLAILGGVGLAAMALSVLLYRLRHLESAGDFVAFRKLKAPSCLIITLCVALCFALLGEAFGSMVVWMIVGVIVGYFGSLMLLERRIKVFRKKTFLGFGALAVAMIISFLAVQFDWFGIVKWTPEADQVKSVTIANYRTTNYYFGYDYDYYYGNRIAVTLTEKDEIADIIEAHEDIIDRMDETSNGIHYVVISYTMNSGRTVTRAYSAPSNGKNYEIFSGYFYTTEQIIGYKDWASFVTGVDYMYYDNGQIPEELYEKVMSALKTACEKGYVTVNYPKDYAYYLEYYATEQAYTVSRTLYISDKATELIEVLESPEVVLGYTDWQKYLEGIQEISVNGGPLKQEQYEGLLTALREDCRNGYLSREPKDGHTTVEIGGITSTGSYNHRVITIGDKMLATCEWLRENAYLGS